MGILSGLFSISWGILTQAFALFTNQLKGGAQLLVKFHQEGISYARSVGMSLKESQAYTNTLIARTEVLAQKYGVAAEQIAAVQKNLSEATGRAMMLNDTEAERMVQINKLVGESTNKAFMSEIMQHMGGQLSTAQGAVSKAYATAAKRGLDAANYSAKVAQNLTLANKLSFRNGIDGIIKMTTLSEKLGFNLQSVERAASNFMDLDKAIEHSAQLQMLGGSASVYGSNPLAMSYEANYDPEAFTERMTKTLSGLATFDKKTGMANVNGMNRDFVKSISEAMGISFEEAMSIAKKNAEINYKERAYAPARSKYTEDEWDFIMNKSYVDAKTGKLMMQDASGKEHDISQGMDKALIAEMKKFDAMDEKALMETQAHELTSINEKLKGISESVLAQFAKALQPVLDLFMPQMDNLGNLFMKMAKPFAEAVPHILTPLAKAVTDAIPKISAWFDKNGDKITEMVVGFAKDVKKAIKETIETIKKVGEYGGIIVNTIKWLGVGLFGYLAYKGIKGSVDAYRNVSNFFRGRHSASPSGTPRIGSRGSLGRTARSLSSKVSKIWTEPLKVLKKSPKEAKMAFRVAKNVYKQDRGRGLSKFSSLKGGLKEVVGIKKVGYLSNLSKLIKGGGLGIAGAIGNIAVDSAVEKGKIERGGIGHYGGKMASTAAEYAAFGALIGPLGAGVGAAVGAVKGAYDTWKSLPENADKNFIDYAKSVGDSIIEGGKNAFNWAKEKVGPALSSVNKEIQDRGGYLSVAFNLITTPIKVFIKTLENIAKFIMSPIETVKNIWSSLTKWWNSDNKFGSIVGGISDFIFGKKKENHAHGGIVGGNSYSGDKVVVGLNSGEMVLNKSQQTNLFNLLSSGISSGFKLRNDVKAKPIGEKEYIYVPKSSETYNVNGNTVTVKDFNIKIDGTIKLDASNYIKSLDVKGLLEDHAFVSSLKTMIKDSINADINNGRVMNDVATLRGNTNPTTIWGRRR